MLARLFAVAIAAFAAPTNAAVWRHLTTNDPGGAVYYDASSIRRVGNNVRLWIKVDHSRDRSTRVRLTLELWSYNCDARTTLAISSYNYLPDGTVLSQRTLYDDPADYTPVIPESVAETAMQMVCQR